jgi:hypothetical protein
MCSACLIVAMSAPALVRRAFSHESNTLMLTSVASKLMMSTTTMISMSVKPLACRNRLA